MARIYEHKRDQLGVLLRRASSEQGATVLIPDLQRPFVWRPDQVILLVDSLIRGWPFGTLLTWNVADTDGAVMPWRPFWRLFDKTRDEDTDSDTVASADRPAPFQMVLDGQQRIQSLLLALGGDGWGFRLDDRDWKESLEGQRPRGRRLVHPHWTRASLHFDIEVFFQEYTQHQHVINIDYRKVLKWCAPSQDCYSRFPTPDNYERPVSLRQDLEPEGRQLVQLSRIWNATPADENLAEAGLRRILFERLVNEGFAEEPLKIKLSALGEFMVALRSAKLGEVAYLEVRPFNPDIWDPTQYGQAVVDIFTRLNTAGRTLTKEEITFAWIKSGWDPAQVGGERAEKCFKKLLEMINASNVIELELDELVRVISALWALRHNDGVPLDNADLLEGAKVRPMAVDIASDWKLIVEAFESCVQQLAVQELEFGQNRWFNSLNSFSFLLAFHMRWQLERASIHGEMDRHNAEVNFHALMKDFGGRWLFNSTWSGYWSSASGSETRQRFQDLRAALFADGDLGFQERIENAQRSLLERVTNKAVEAVTVFETANPRMVSRYYPLLWLWLRLDQDRLRAAAFPLRTAGRKAPSWDVDHVVASSFWHKAVEQALENHEISLDEVEDLKGRINQIGNCMLLEKNFNVSKSAYPLDEWLDKVDQFADPEFRESWSRSLGVEENLRMPNGRSLEELTTAFEARTATIRAELTDYVRGDRERVDID